MTFFGQCDLFAPPLTIAYFAPYVTLHTNKSSSFECVGKYPGTMALGFGEREPQRDPGYMGTISYKKVGNEIKPASAYQRSRSNADWRPRTEQNE
jgi:hypothetical protein